MPELAGVLSPRRIRFGSFSPSVEGHIEDRFRKPYAFRSAAFSSTMRCSSRLARFVDIADHVAVGGRRGRLHDRPDVVRALTKRGHFAGAGFDLQLVDLRRVVGELSFWRFRPRPAGFDEVEVASQASATTSRIRVEPVRPI